jgi:hypothetical protein
MAGRQLPLVKGLTDKRFRPEASGYIALLRCISPIDDSMGDATLLQSSDCFYDNMSRPECSDHCILPSVRL